jgi:hypothetical protein
MKKTINSTIDNWNVCCGCINNEKAIGVSKVQLYTEALIKGKRVLCKATRISQYCEDTLHQTFYENGIVIEHSPTAEIIWFVDDFDSSANGLKPRMEKSQVKGVMGSPRGECSHFWGYRSSDNPENMIVLFFENDLLKTVFYSEHDCGLD